MGVLPSVVPSKLFYVTLFALTCFILQLLYFHFFAGTVSSFLLWSSLVQSSIAFKYHVFLFHIYISLFLFKIQFHIEKFGSVSCFKNTHGAFCGVQRI
jgi:hypothetical protein